MRTLIGSETDPVVLAQLARGKLQKKQAERAQALEGRFRAHHRFLRTHLLGHLDFLDVEIATLDERIKELVAAISPCTTAVERLDSSPGINRTTALIIVAEIGVDMARYPSDCHVTAWAGLSPGNNETGGKQRTSSTRKGNHYLRRALVQAAQAAARKKGNYLKTLYHRLAARRGAKWAAVAVARTLVQIAYHLIAREQTYQDLGGDYFDPKDRERTRRRLVQRLQALGFTVIVQDAERSAAEPVLAAT